MQLLKNTHFSWGTRCLVLRYELNVYVNKIVWVLHPCHGFTNLWLLLLFIPNSHFWHLQVVFGYPSVRKRTPEKPTDKESWPMVSETSVHVCVVLFLWACDKTRYHIARTMGQSSSAHIMTTEKQGQTRTGPQSGSSSLTHCQLPCFLPGGTTS